MESSNTHTDIAVITSITGDKDFLIEEQAKGNAKFFAFMDSPQWSDTWSIFPACDKFADPRRNSRMAKLLPHKYVNAKYSIWIDGNIRLLITPEEAIGKYLKNHDIAVFAHPNRDCLYDEAMVCAKLQLDDPELIIEQVVAYEKSGFPKHRGLHECGIIMRRHTPEVEAFNNAWFAEYSRYSRRDQISFPFAADRIGIRVNAVKMMFEEEGGRFIRDGAFEIVPHQNFEGNFNQPPK